jgi:hypothetical protein
MTEPPFTGSIDFELTIGARDVRVLRQARVTYAYTPAWPYYDGRTGKERGGVPQLDVGLSVLALPRSGRSRTCDIPTRRYWTPLGQLLTIGILSARVHDRLRCRVDVEARDADRKYRVRAGLPVPPLPDQI